MAKYAMNQIKDDYGNFSSPAFSVKINGTALDPKYCMGELEVELSAAYDAGGCTIQIHNGFVNSKNVKLALVDDLKRLVKPGNKVEVAVGYRGGKAESIFTGYIDAVSVEYDKEEGVTYIIDCLDGKGIMMNSLRSEAKVSMKRYSDAVEKTLKKYSSVIKIKSQNFDKSDPQRNRPIEQHNESDYHFVVRIAKKLGYCFYIDKGEVIFKPFSKLSKEVFFEFDMSQFVYSFQMETSLKNQVSAVTVRANNEKDPKQPFETKVTSAKSITDNSSVKMNTATLISNEVAQTIIDYSASSEEETKKFAEAKFQQLSINRFSGKIKTVGIPVMTAGKVVAVKGFGDAFDKKYFVRKVVHRIHDGRYTTECELEGNKA